MGGGIKGTIQTLIQFSAYILFVLILPKSMLCVVKKYSMNGCEMSSLFLGHFYFIKWYLKEKDQEKTKPNWKNFGKKRMTNSHFLASSPSILKRFLASPLHHM